MLEKVHRGHLESKLKFWGRFHFEYVSLDASGTMTTYHVTICTHQSKTLRNQGRNVSVRLPKGQNTRTRKLDWNPISWEERK